MMKFEQDQSRVEVTNKVALEEEKERDDAVVVFSL
jgi:hypothetical protein